MKTHEDLKHYSGKRHKKFKYMSLHSIKSSWFYGRNLFNPPPTPLSEIRVIKTQSEENLNHFFSGAINKVYDERI